MSAGITTQAAATTTPMAVLANLTLLPPGALVPRPKRSCCCPAPYMVVVSVPWKGGQPADIWLCAHHYNINRTVLALQGAQAWKVM